MNVVIPHTIELVNTCNPMFLEIKIIMKLIFCFSLIDIVFATRARILYQPIKCSAVCNNQ